MTDDPNAGSDTLNEERLQQIRERVERYHAIGMDVAESTLDGFTPMDDELLEEWMAIDRSFPDDIRFLLAAVERLTTRVQDLQALLDSKE